MDERRKSAYQMTGAELGLPWNLCELAEASRRAGETQAGLRFIADAFVLEATRKEAVWEAEPYRAKGELLLNAAYRMQKGEQEATEEEHDSVVLIQR